MALAAILAATAIPQTLAGLDRARTIGAARYLAGRLALARTQAVARGANVALQFVATDGTFTIGSYRDGNGNGVRATDITAGVDPVLEPPIRFSTLFPRVALSLGDPADATVQTTALMSFSAIGTASSRTLYLTGPDGSQYGVRVLGATGRSRVLRYVTTTRQWLDVL